MSNYLEYLTSLGLSHKTTRVYIRCVERFVAWCVEERLDAPRVEAISLAEYAQYIPMTAASRRQHRVALRHWFESIGRDDPPIRAIRVPPKKRGVSRAMEPDEARRFVEASIGVHPAGTAMLFGMYLGLRREEIANARWDRFDRDLEWYTVFGKWSVEATLPVHPVLAGQLTGRISAFPWIFPGRNTGHVSSGTIGQWCNEIADAAGVSDVSPHRLRHTAIATVNDETGDLRAAQEFARHADPSTTTIYTRVNAQRLVRAVTSLRYVA